MARFEGHRRIAVCLAVANLLASPALAADQSEALGWSKLGSAIMAGRTAASEMQRLDTQIFIDAAEEEMRHDVGRFAGRAVAEQQLNSWLKGLLEDRARETLQHYAAGIGLKQDAVREVASSLHNEVGTQADNYVRQNGATVFQAARAVVVGEQIRALQAASYPAPDTVSEADRNGLSEAERQRLQDLIARQIEERLPQVFEEVSNEVHGRAEGVVTDIVAQRTVQQKFVAADVPASLVTSTQIETWLTGEAERKLAALRIAGQDRRIVYDLLPSIRTGFAERAESEEKLRWRNFLQNLHLPFETDALAAEISANLTLHHDPAESETILVQDRYAEAAQLALQTRLQQAASAPDVNDYRTRLEATIASNEVRDVLLSALRASVSSPLHEARRRIAERQLRVAFPGLGDRSWQPPERLITAVELGKIAPVPVQSFTDAQTLFASATEAKSHGESFLQETEHAALAAIRALLEEGRRAWRGQDRVVKRLDDQIEQELHRTTDFSTENFTKLYERFTNQAQRDWDASRTEIVWKGAAQLPPNAAQKYAPLFEYMREKIRERIRDSFKPPDVKPEQPAPQPKPLMMQTTPANNQGGPDKGVDHGDRSGGNDTFGVLGRWLAWLSALPWLLWLLALLAIVLELLVLARGLSRKGLIRVQIDVTDLERMTEAFRTMTDMNLVSMSAMRRSFRKGINEVILVGK